MLQRIALYPQCVYLVTGLVNLPYNGNKLQGKTQPFPPGHVETYSLADDGKAYFLERMKFHSIGTEPQYLASVTKSGNLMYVIMYNY